MAWFLTSIWPQARARHPQARLRITGEWRPDTRTVLGRVPGVEFVGFVPDLAKTLAGSVLIAPVRIGSGVRIKLIQGAAFSLPMISTTIAAEGISLRPGREFICADSPAEWVAAIDSLLGNATLGSQLAEAAYRRISGRFTAEHCAERRDQIYREILALALQPGP